MRKNHSFGQISLDKDHWSRYTRKELKAVGKQLEEVLIGSDPKQTLFELDSKGFFQIFIPELHKLKSVPQHKQNSQDAFHHSILVVHHASSDRIVKWAALLHDVGKSNYKVNFDGSLQFRHHEYEGSVIARDILGRFKISKPGEICKLVRYHSHPLDYQRQPNWKIATVKNFCEKYQELAPHLVDLAIADKISSSSNSLYLEELYKLKIMVEEIQNV
jgi:poly(A) polymerase